MVTWIVFKYQLLEVGLTQNPETMALRTLTTVDLLYSITRVHRMNRNPLKQHLVEGPVTYDFTRHLRVRDHTTRVSRCVGTAFGHFLFGSHNFMFTTLGSCVK